MPRDLPHTPRQSQALLTPVSFSASSADPAARHHHPLTAEPVEPPTSRGGFTLTRWSREHPRGGPAVSPNSFQGKLVLQREVARAVPAPERQPGAGSHRAEPATPCTADPPSARDRDGRDEPCPRTMRRRDALTQFDVRSPLQSTPRTRALVVPTPTFPALDPAREALSLVAAAEIRPLSDETLPQHAGQLLVPTYDRSALTPAVVHFSVGGFHRSHQLLYFDEIAERRISDGWGVVGVGLNSRTMKDALAPQDHLYTVVERSPDGERARVVGVMTDYHYAPDDPAAVLDVLTDERTRMVSLTITGGGYRLCPQSGEFDADDEDIAWDLRETDRPRSV